MSTPKTATPLPSSPASQIISQAVSGLSHWSQSASFPYGNAFYDSDALGAGFSSRVYAFISYFEISARFAANASASAVDEIKRLYGWMSVNDPGVTMWEGVGTNGTKYEGGVYVVCTWAVDGSIGCVDRVCARCYGDGGWA